MNRCTAVCRIFSQVQNHTVDLNEDTAEDGEYCVSPLKINRFLIA